MKQNLKYGLLVVLVLLLHSIVVGATESTTIPDNSLQERCFISQARPMHNAIERLYHFYSALSCELGQADASHISLEKAPLRLSIRQREFQGIIPYTGIYSTQHYTHNPQNPIVHYIYGQRKIRI